MDSILANIGLKEIVLIIIAIWFILSLTKKLFKMAIVVAIVLAAVYFLYPEAANLIPK